MRQFPCPELLRTLLACLLFAAVAVAQPSGGPYGPLQQHYPEPEADTVYYVSANGEPEADGRTLDTPTTLEAAIARVVTGDAIVLRGGVYRTGSLRLSQGITMQPYRDERPIIKGTRLATDWEASEDGRWRTAWSTLFPAAPADWWRLERHVDRTPLHRFHNDMVFVDGERLLSVGRLEDVSEKTYYIDYERGHVHLGLDPTGRQVEITAHDSALVRTMRPAHGKPNDGIGPVIRGITFTQYAYLALEVQGIEPGELMDPADFGKEVVGTVLEHLEISHCSRVAGYFRGDQLVIRHSLIADCGTEGIYVINSADVLLERNIVTRTNSHEQFSGYYASAIKIFNQSYRTVCRDNLIIDNPHASGIWYDVGNIGGIVVNNWVERTKDGFFFEISSGAICAGNVFVDCTPGVRILNSADVEVYQNTFYNSALELGRTMRSSEAGDHFGWHASTGPGVAERDGHLAVNNLFAADESFTAPLVQLWQPAEVDEHAAQEQLSRMEGNAFVTRTPTQLIAAWSAYPLGPAERSAASLAQLDEQLPGSAAHSTFRPAYYGPLFPSPRLRNFQLLDSFPLDQASAPLPPRILKSLNWPAARSPFPGAYPPLEMQR
ncbi:MAG: right-handed parallel beta-helix repeat-containing protein [Opitutales bacterium]